MRGSVQKKGKRYYIVYTVGRKQKWERVPEPNTKKNAERLLAQRVTEINRGTYREIKKTTFKEFADRWLRNYVDDPHFLKASSARHYHTAFRVHLLPFFGDYALTDITPEMIQEFVSNMSKAGKAAETIHSSLTPLTTMFKHAIQQSFLKTSPMPFVNKPKIKRKEMAFLSAVEVQRFLEHVTKEWHTFFLTAALTGMRLGELLAMRWKNLDWEEGQYHVKERLYEGLFDTPKTPTSIRTVDLTPMVVETLRTHKARQNQNRLTEGEDYQDSDLTFCSNDGSPITNTKALRNVFNASLKAAKCLRIRLHDLRHTYVTLQINQNASPKYIQRQLGHASVNITFDTYGHLMPEAREEIVRGLDRQVFGTT